MVFRRLVPLLLLATLARTFVLPQRHCAQSSLSASRPDTDDLLIRAAQVRREGLRQEYGVTIKKDGLDEVRALVWAVFRVTEYVFPALGRSDAQYARLRILL